MSTCNQFKRIRFVCGRLIEHLLNVSPLVTNSNKMISNVFKNPFNAGCRADIICFHSQ